jgi:hypothetical protein
MCICVRDAYLSIRAKLQREYDKRRARGIGQGDGTVSRVSRKGIEDTK